MILKNSYQPMGEIFDKYKTLEGWLEIKIDTYNPF